MPSRLASLRRNSSYASAVGHRGRGFVAGIVLWGVLIVCVIGFALILHRATLYRTHSLSDPLTGAVNRRGAASAIDALTEERAMRVCRLGGDEFLCIIAPPTAKDQLRSVAERLRKTVSRPYEHAAEQYIIGRSVGISIYPQHGETAGMLLDRADRAMYAAKNSGAACAKRYDARVRRATRFSRTAGHSGAMML